MSTWLVEHFAWWKAFHIIFVISWMAGLLYLPRLFVYHCRAEAGSVFSETMKLMEHRLARYIMLPALVGSFVFGTLMLVMPGVLRAGGFSLYLKLVLVLILAGFHAAMLRWKQAFAEDRNNKSEKFFRVANEVPTLLMIAIVILIVVRPFQ